MPTYDYRCSACGHTFEHFQAISDPLLTKCPGCGRKKLERLIGAGAGLLFKGSGFYITDYRSSSWQEAAKKDAAPGASSPAPAAPGGDAGAKSSPSPAGGASAAKPAPKPASAPAKSSPSGGGSGSSKSGGSRGKR